MMKTFLITFDHNVINTQQLLQYFDLYPAFVRNWINPYNGCVIIASENTVPDLENLISAGFVIGTFIVAEIKGNTTSGRWIQTGWDFINTPQSLGRWETVLATPSIFSQFNANTPLNQAINGLGHYIQTANSTDERSIHSALSALNHINNKK